MHKICVEISWQSERTLAYSISTIDDLLKNVAPIANLLGTALLAEAMGKFAWIKLDRSISRKRCLKSQLERLINVINSIDQIFCVVWTATKKSEATPTIGKKRTASYVNSSFGIAGKNSGRRLETFCKISVLIIERMGRIYQKRRDSRFVLAYWGCST